MSKTTCDLLWGTKSFRLFGSSLGVISLSVKKELQCPFLALILI